LAASTCRTEQFNLEQLIGVSGARRAGHVNELTMGEAESQALDVVDRLIEEAEVRHVDQIDHLSALVACGECITEAKRILAEIEDHLVHLNDQRISLSTPEPTP
jgi:bacterioferritin-associated ferredoxin